MANLDRQNGGPEQRRRSHEELRDLLPAYVADLALGAGPPAHNAELAAHLAECAECREEVDELAELLREAAAGSLPQASSYPPLALGFLRARPAAPCALDQLGRIVVRFSAALLEQIRPAALPALARSTERRGAQLYQYDHARFAPADPPQPATLTISVFGVGPGPDTVEVVVRVGVVGRRATDLAGSEVTLAVGERVRRGSTDRFGYVTFPDIATADLPMLQVTVAPTGGQSA